MIIPKHLEATLRHIGSLRLDDMPKTGGKLALCRLQYAVCAARDVLTRSGLNDVGPLEKAARHDVAMEMKRNGDKLETEWQHERIGQAREKDRAASREPDELTDALEARVLEQSDRISALLTEKAEIKGELMGLTKAKPLGEWTEEDGFVTWWKLPVCEPAWVGCPNCSDWPGYHTHWTPHPPLPVS